MSDPTPLPPVPERKTNAQAFGQMGIPANIPLAKRKLAAGRKRRPKPKVLTMEVHTRIPEPQVDALYAIAERYAVNHAGVMRKFIEDGLRAYGNAEELAMAGLAPKELPNPFDPLSVTPPTASTHYTYQGGTPVPTVPTVYVPPPSVVMPGGGPPLPTDAAAYEQSPTPDEDDGA